MGTSLFFALPLLRIQQLASHNISTEPRSQCVMIETSWPFWQRLRAFYSPYRPVAQLVSGIPKNRMVCARLWTQVEMDGCVVLIQRFQIFLLAKVVGRIRRAQCIHLDHDVACVREPLSLPLGAGGDAPACPASPPSSSTCYVAVKVLGDADGVSLGSI